jgi:hypothetical protein
VAGEFVREIRPLSGDPGETVTKVIAGDSLRGLAKTLFAVAATRDQIVQDAPDILHAC